MSIAENHGGLYNNLRQLRNSQGKTSNNIFKARGFDYYYLEEGNNIQKLIEIFEEVKDKNHPIVVHIKTEKGKGLDVAEVNKESFHWILPGTLDIKNDEEFALTEPSAFAFVRPLELKIPSYSTTLKVGSAQIFE